MTVKEAIIQRRTIRKFTQMPIPPEVLLELVEAGRVAPSGGNLQPLKYKIVTGALCEDVFSHVRWAAYLKDGAPKEDERPTAYILILADTKIRKSGYEFDMGAAAENIQLAAWEKGIGACWMGSIDRKEILALCGIDDTRYVMPTLLALGYSGQESYSEDCTDDSIKYYSDENGVIHVPKRTDILL